MARLHPGAVVVFEVDGRAGWGQPPKRNLATVVGGPREDGTYDLDCQNRVRPECIRCLSPGEMIEYYSASMNKWIPARVLREGRVPGSFDLDCKEGVDSRRMRLPEGGGEMAPAPGAGAPHSKPAYAPFPEPAPVAAAAPAAAAGAAAPGDGPLGLRRGDDCLYKSSTHGWIPAVAMQFHPEDQSYDLDVKIRVRTENIHCVRVGDMIEYQSMSTNRWIPARVLRKAQGSGLYDLDCKAEVPLKRLRPPQDSLENAGRKLGFGDAGAPAPPAGMGSPNAGAFAREDSGSYLGSRSSVGDSNVITGDSLDHPYTGGGRGAHAMQGGLQPTPEDYPLQDDGRVPDVRQRARQWENRGERAPTVAKLRQLRDAVKNQDQSMIRQRLESTSALKLVGEELDHAAHALWALEARPAASEDLRKAAMGSNVDALHAAIEAAAVTGVSDRELDAATLALEALESSQWRYEPPDGNHIDIRSAPRIDGQRTRNRLHAGEVFAATKEVRGDDGSLYLKLADGRGWVFERKPGVGTLCVRHEVDNPGVYVITHDRAAVTHSMAMGNDEDIIAKLAFGAIIKVLEVARSQEKRVRGRIDHPAGWISLMNLDTGKRWAQPQRE